MRRREGDMDDVDRLWVGHAVVRAMPVDPEVVFGVLTDVAALPSWNETIAAVLTAPTSMGAGEHWTVQMQVGDRQWVSRSVVSLHDRSTLRFSHRSSVEGGDASYADWRWHVAQEADGCTVRVGWVLRSFGPQRRLVADPLRDRRLRTEVPASLHRLQAVSAGAAMRDPRTATLAN
jgi:hypothetical protein